MRRSIEKFGRWLMADAEVEDDFDTGAAASHPIAHIVVPSGAAVATAVDGEDEDDLTFVEGERETGSGNTNGNANIYSYNQLGGLGSGGSDFSSGSGVNHDFTLSAAAAADSYSSKKTECCPLVVDPLALTAVLGFIAAATAFLNVAITMNIVGRRKRRKRSIGEAPGKTDSAPISEIVLQGTSF